MSDPFERAVEREAQERRARRRRGPWRRLGIHLRIYLIVNAALVAVWAIDVLLTGPHVPPFVHVAWAWGIGLLVHYLVVTQVTKQWWPQRDGPTSSTAVGPNAEH